MKYNTIEELQDEGFVGFHTIASLHDNFTLIPETHGIYLVLCPDLMEPKFLAVGTGAHLGGKSGDVSIERLSKKWVKDRLLLYIGKAGGGKHKTNLRVRIRAYILYGHGKTYTHKGGRFIWQLENALDLIVCWKETPYEDPRNVETNLIQLFALHNDNKYPFANINK